MIDHYIYETSEEQADALATAVATSIKSSLENKNISRKKSDFISSHDGKRVTLAVSGGKSPFLFLEKLSRQWIDWHLVDVLLVDERWVSPGHRDSNYQLVRDALLQNLASDAKLHPLYDETLSIKQQVDCLNKNWKLPDVVVLGMGDDGHTASLFRDSPEWDQSISTGDLFVAVSPKVAPHLRISLSLSSLLTVENLFLQFTGLNKQQVFKDAESQSTDNAISLLIARRKKQFNIYSCLPV